MALSPESKIKLEDVPKVGNLAKAASLPGTGAGASKIRDLSSPSDMTADGITTNINAPKPYDGKVLAERDGIQLRPSSTVSGGTDLVNADGTPASGYVWYLNEILTHDEFRAGMDSGAYQPTSRPMDVSGTGSGQEAFPVIEPQPWAPSGENIPGVSNEFKFDAGIDPRGYSGEYQFSAEEFMIDPATGFQTAAKDALKAILSADFTEIGKLADGIDFEGTAKPTFVVTDGFLDSVSKKDREALSFLWGEEIEIGLQIIQDYRGDSIEQYVFINPQTGVAIRGPNDGDQPGDVLIAPQGAALHEANRMVAAAANELKSKNIALLTEAEITERRDRLTSALQLLNQQESTAFKQHGNRIQAVMEANLQFERTFKQDQADDQFRFQTGLANFNAENDFLRQTLQFSFQDQQRQMELAWLNGSPGEARAARLQSQNIERRQIQLQERELLVSTLAILGQHPQLRGAIKALGLFEGHGGGQFDFDAFFGGTLGTASLPSAQEFNRLAPSAQDAMVNELAGKHGMKPEIILQTIRSQSPSSTRRLI